MRGWFLILVGLFGAALFSQVPAFHDQYIQRLGGHIDEIEQQIAALDERAARVGKDRFTYIRDFRANPDLSVRLEGDYLLDMLSRHVRLTQSRDRLTAISWLYVAPALAVEAEPAIARRTLEDFMPALPLSLIGIGHAVAGFFLFYLGMMGFLALIPGRRARAGG